MQLAAVALHIDREIRSRVLEDLSAEDVARCALCAPRIGSELNALAEEPILVPSMSVAEAAAAAYMIWSAEVRATRGEDATAPLFKQSGGK